MIIHGSRPLSCLMDSQSPIVGFFPIGTHKIGKVGEVIMNIWVKNIFLLPKYYEYNSVCFMLARDLARGNFGPGSSGLSVLPDSCYLVFYVIPPQGKTTILIMGKCASCGKSVSAQVGRGKVWCGNCDAGEDLWRERERLRKAQEALDAQTAAAEAARQKK